MTRWISFTRVKHAGRTFLTFRYLPIVLALLALLLTANSIKTGLQLDDYFHWHRLVHPDQFPATRNPITNLFTFAWSPEQIHQMMHDGRLPWWTLDELRVTFFRPLSAMTHWLDYRLWPETPALMHVHSLLWFASLVFVAAMIYRKMMAPLWLAGLAALLYAVDDAHAVPAGWIANRNALIAGVFGFLCLYFHVRWRREGWRPAAVLAPLCLLLGLLSGEAAVAVGAYLFAYEVCLSAGQWRQKTAALWPYAFIGLVWWTVYHALGFGTYGSGAYIDPGQSPLTFLAILFERIPLLLHGQWLLPDPGLYGFLPKTVASIVLIIVYALLAGILYVLIPLLKRDPLSLFWALGMVLSLLPSAATFPMNRLLVFAGLGAMGLLAQLMAAWFEKPDWLPASRLWRVATQLAVAILILVHTVAAPLLLHLDCRVMTEFSELTLENPLKRLSREVDLRDKTLVLLNPPVPFVASYVSIICRKSGWPVPRKTRVLSSGLTSRLNVLRLDAYSLEIEPEKGFLNQDLEIIYRGATHPMHAGQQVDMGDMLAEVLTLTPDQRPLRVRFTFPKPLDDPSFVFCQWQKDHFKLFTPPNEGRSVKLEALLALQ